MKQSFTLALLLVFSCRLFAQGKLHYHQKNDGYVEVYSGGMYFSSPEPQGNFSFAFPYAQKNITTGQVTNGIFNASQNFNFKPIAPVMGLEVGGGRAFADLEVGLFTSNWPNSGLFNIGGGVMYGLGHTTISKSGNKRKGHGAPASDSRFLLKLSLNMNVTEHNFDLGSIDNSNYEISVLNSTAPSNYIVHHKYSFPKTVDAKQLNISYDEYGFCFLPKVTLSNNSFNDIFSFSASCTYIMPMLKYERLILNQDNYNPVANVGVNSNGLSAKFNGVPFSKAPFQLQGLYFSVSVGVNIGMGR